MLFSSDAPCTLLITFFVNLSSFFLWTYQISSFFLYSLWAFFFLITCFPLIFSFRILPYFHVVFARIEVSISKASIFPCSFYIFLPFSIFLIISKLKDILTSIRNLCAVSITFPFPMHPCFLRMYLKIGEMKHPWHNSSFIANCSDIFWQIMSNLDIDFERIREFSNWYWSARATLTKLVLWIYKKPFLYTKYVTYSLENHYSSSP